MKKGLIMEGGAMRGLFTAGVIDVMMENEIEFDGAIGVSAGAAFGCNYKSKQIGRVLRYNEKYCKDKRFCSLRSLITTGDLFGAEFCYHTLPQKLDIFDTETFENNPMEFYVVCTDVITGQPVYRRCDVADDNCLEWIRASASMPLVSRVVETDGYKMLDGGISDSVPIKYFEKIGYDRNIVILTQPAEYIKKKNKLIFAMKIFLRKYPKLIDTIEKRHESYNKTIEYICEKEKKGEVIVIRPEKILPISRIEHNCENIRNVYNLGREKGKKHISDIKEFLKEKSL